MRTQNRQKGFTLIELAIVLGVFAIIVAGIWLVVAVVYGNVRQYQANRELQSTVQNVRQLLQRITRFTSTAGTDMTTTLDSQSAFPVEMRISEGAANGNLNNPWTNAGNSVHAFVRDVMVFGIEFKGIPAKPCTQIVTKLSSGELSGLSALVVNGTSTTAANLPVPLVTAATLCTSATDNHVEWQFTLRGG